MSFFTEYDRRAIKTTLYGTHLSADQVETLTQAIDDAFLIAAENYFAVLALAKRPSDHDEQVPVDPAPEVKSAADNHAFLRARRKWADAVIDKCRLNDAGRADSVRAKAAPTLEVHKLYRTRDGKGYVLIVSVAAATDVFIYPYRGHVLYDGALSLGVSFNEDGKCGYDGETRFDIDTESAFPRWYKGADKPWLEYSDVVADFKSHHISVDN